MKTNRTALIWILAQMCLLPLVARAQFEFVTNADNTLTITAYSGTSSIVVVPDFTNGHPVGSIGAGAFSYQMSLTNVMIPDSVVSIGTAAFNACGLTNVVFGSGLNTIGGEAFRNCALSNVVAIPDCVTSIGTNAFYACRSLAGVTIPGKVTSIGNDAFRNCSGLTSVTIPASVTRLGTYVFAYCTNLHQAYFLGNAPNGGGSCFHGESGTAYYVPGTGFWGSAIGGWPSVGWYQPRPQILASPDGPGMRSDGFGFAISWATNASIVVEASVDLRDWSPVRTNTLVKGTNHFVDPSWTDHPQRCYRVRSQ